MARKLRVGAVNYLNTKPLVERLPELVPEIDLSLDLPSRLADSMRAGELDIGLIPVVEYLRAGDYSFVPDVSIATRGPVLSVTLFSRVPWDRITTLALDVGSRTSAALTRILLEKRFGVRPRLETLPMGVSPDDVSADAVLLIGDRAMAACLPGFAYAYDLGQEWADYTGHPMVFAVWAVRPGVELSPDTVLAFQKARDLGLAEAGKIAAREAPLLGLDAGFCRRYLTNILYYHLGPRELAGLRLYADFAGELGLAPTGVTLVDYDHRFERGPDFSQVDARRAHHV